MALASQITYITGTAAVTSFTPPSVAFIGCLALHAAAAWSTKTTGNIAYAMTAVPGAQYTACFYKSKWYVK